MFLGRLIVPICIWLCLLLFHQKESLLLFLCMIHFFEKERYSSVIYHCLWTYFKRFCCTSIVNFWQLSVLCGSSADSFILRNIQVFRGSCLRFSSCPIPWSEALILALCWQLFFYFLCISKLLKPNRVIFLQDQFLVAGHSKTARWLIPAAV